MTENREIYSSRKRFSFYQILPFQWRGSISTWISDNFFNKNSNSCFYQLDL